MILEWIGSACALILVVLCLRAAMGRRISARLRYALWAVVLLRLLVPVQLFTSPVAGMAVDVPGIEALEEQSVYLLPVQRSSVEEASNVVVRDGAVVADGNSFGYARLEDGGDTVVRYARRASPLQILRWLWLAGSCLTAAALLVSNFSFYRRLRRVRRPLADEAGAYVAEGLPSPCLFGLFCPAVYVTPQAAEDAALLRHVLVHERTHRRHLDHIWSLLRCAALALHWWNPLVWLAAALSRRDGELACDEAALGELGDGERRAYGETLLKLVTARPRPGDLLCCATTMAGDKRSLKERFQWIACQPKQLVSAMIAVVAVLSLSALVAFCQAKEDSGVLIDPAGDDARLGDAWKTAGITVDQEGVPHIRYTLSDGSEETWNGAPIPAPREWADQDGPAGRSEATALVGGEGYPEIWAKMVSPTDGWLVACYGRGVAAADTYVYKTSSRGVTWDEVAMPGTSWHIADVGFLSENRLIVAQRLFDGAPCFITKDGGESWEEIELPDRQALSIRFDGNTVAMDIGAHEDGPATYTMLSPDQGDSWMVSSPGLQWIREVDLDHDGLPDFLKLRKIPDSGEAWKLEFTASYMSSPTWEEGAFSAHVGWISIFLCRLDGEDYLLRYIPYMGGGSCDYRYQLFYLTAEGREVVVQENSVEFDLIFDPDYADRHQYDPWAINTFMEEINALLENSEQLVNTDENLLGTFEKEGRLYDSLWWLDDGNTRDGDLSLLDNLLNYANYAQDHPDDVWSPLADLLMNLTDADITAYAGDTSDLVRLLRAAERGSRFYPWDSYDDAYSGHGAGEYDGGQWHVSLADGSTLHLIASSKSDNVLMILETSNGTTSAFYTAPELNERIRSGE